VGGQFHAPAALPSWKEPPVPIGKEAGWAPEPVWATWRRENSGSYRDSKSDPSAVQPVASCYTDCALPAPHKLFLFHVDPNATEINVGYVGTVINLMTRKFSVVLLVLYRSLGHMLTHLSRIE
jgi:hypothetical protein